LDEIQFFAGEPAEQKKEEVAAPPKPKYDPFDDMMGGDSSDEGDLMDFDLP